MLAIRRIPPAPRRVRWRAVLWFRWPLALVGLIAGVGGGLAALMLAMATARHTEDLRLDRGPVASIEGEVVSVQPTRVEVAGRPAVRATFEYRPDGAVWAEKSVCYAPADDCTPRATVPVEYLPGEPRVARIVGSRLTLQPDLWTPWMLLVVVPGCLAALAWLYGIWRLRAMLRTAEISIADEHDLRLGVWPVPETHEIRFMFRDHRAHRILGKHWIRARSNVGLALTSSDPPRRLAIAHDREDPKTWHRVVHPDDFVPPRAQLRADIDP